MNSVLKLARLPSLIKKRSFRSPILPEISASFSSSIKEKILQQRLQRLKSKENNEALPTKTSNDISLIRNIGIIAHIDAGQTTTTQKMLYFSGVLPEPGKVDDGSTVMDYLEQQRERGITIRAAAISFNWDNHQINLIDTPGHIDFTAEVQRSLRVLDGAVAIFDAVSGVQTQSEIVWLQSNQFKIPRLTFINQMDRAGANFEKTISSIKQKLNVTPFILQYPLGEQDKFTGVVDLLSMKKYIWKEEEGNEVFIEEVRQDESIYEKVAFYRQKLLDDISLVNDQIAESLISGKQIPDEKIHDAIRQTLIENSTKFTAVNLGSSLQNQGIQPLLDSVVNLLPSPLDRPFITNFQDSANLRRTQQDEQLTGYAFQVINDPQKGPLTFIRVYTGCLLAKGTFKNVSRDILEKSGVLYRVRANNYVNIQQISCGDIAAVTGLNGDTLLDHKDTENFHLEEMVMPDAVFTASIQYQFLQDQPKLDKAIMEIQKQDNSLVFKQDQQTGQLIVSGLGQLHLEVGEQL